tara:strand:+ start:23179 stop:23991 length:813 start_codon:yes stop_codon:yes gene_type:complete
LTELQTILITTKEDLLPYGEKICELFKECFQSDMSVEMWEWAYLNNVYGNPVVAMSFDGDRLIGHYAVIPNDIANNQNEELKSALSMTTMVAESHRKHYLFTKLAEVTYEELKWQGYDLVCGFPNASSAPGFKKRLEWIIEKPDFVAEVTKEQLLNSADIDRFLSQDNRFGFEINNSQKTQWRLEKPGIIYDIIGNAIVKEFNGSIDLMHLNKMSLQSLNSDQAYNVLLHSSVKDLLNQKVFEYQFGYRAFNEKAKGLSFNPSMIMSDVF